LSGLGALAVDDRNTRARRAPVALAGLDIERMVDALQRAVPIPQHKVGMRGAFGGKSFGNACHWHPVEST
jgi:hypothetical protein